MPIKVLITPIPRFSTKTLNLLEALFLIVPLPANIIGFVAFVINSTASLIALLSAAGLLVKVGFIGSSFISSFAISSGNSITVTPGFSVSATLNAFLTTSVIFFGDRIVCAHLEIGATILIESII